MKSTKQIGRKRKQQPRPYINKYQKLKEKDLLPKEIPGWLLNKENPPKDQVDRKFRKDTKMPKWKKKMNALDWLYELFWSESKI